MVMDKHHHKSTRRLPPQCGQRFLVNPRLGQASPFLPKPSCVRASRASRGKKWLRKNGGKDYFIGPPDAPKELGSGFSMARRNPGYWRPNASEKLALQTSDRPAKENLHCDEITFRYKIRIDTRYALEIALFLHISGVSLQIQ